MFKGAVNNYASFLFEFKLLCTILKNEIYCTDSKTAIYTAKTLIKCFNRQDVLCNTNNSCPDN